MTPTDVQIRLLVWATSDWGRFALRQGARIAVALLLALAVALRPRLAPWLVALWSASSVFTTIRDYRLFRRIQVTIDAQRSLSLANCRVWIGAELVWAVRVDLDHVRLLNTPIQGELFAGDVVSVLPGGGPDEYILNDGTEQKERAR